MSRVQTLFQRPRTMIFLKFATALLFFCLTSVSSWAEISLNPIEYPKEFFYSMKNYQSDSEGWVDYSRLQIIAIQSLKQYNNSSHNPAQIEMGTTSRKVEETICFRQNLIVLGMGKQSLDNFKLSLDSRNSLFDKQAVNRQGNWSGILSLYNCRVFKNEESK